MKARPTAPGEKEPEVEQATIGDCAAPRLAGRVDAGYSEALSLLDEQIGEKAAGRFGRRNPE